MENISEYKYAEVISVWKNRKKWSFSLCLFLYNPCTYVPYDWKLANLFSGPGWIKVGRQFRPAKRRKGRLSPSIPNRLIHDRNTYVSGNDRGARHKGRIKTGEKSFWWMQTRVLPGCPKFKTQSGDANDTRWFTRAPIGLPDFYIIQKRDDLFLGRGAKIRDCKKDPQD